MRLTGAPARRLMSPDEPTSDDPKNCKRASPLQANLTGLSEAIDTLAALARWPAWYTGCANHGDDCCLPGTTRRNAGAISGLGLGLGPVGLARV